MSGRAGRQRNSCCVLTLHSDEEHVSPTLAGNQRTALSTAFEQSVGGHGGPHADRLDPIQAEPFVLGDVLAFELAEDTTDAVGSAEAKAEVPTPRSGHPYSWPGRRRGADR
jgi:hypothetical protein